MKKNIFLTVSWLFLLMPSLSYSAPVNLFIGWSSEAIVHQPVVCELMILNDYGEVDKSVNGSYAIILDYEEEGGSIPKSLQFSLKHIQIKNGMASFEIKNTEEEFVLLKITLPDLKLKWQDQIQFIDKDIAPPQIIDISMESPKILGLKFDEDVEEESALKESHYTVVTNKREQNPSSIEFHQDYVFLKFDRRFDEDEEGYVNVEGIRDLSGNEISSKMRSPEFDSDCGCF